MQANPDAKFYIVMRWAPRWIATELYQPGRLEKCPILSPSEKLLNEYLDPYKQDWGYYVPIFTEEMQTPTCQSEIQRIAVESQSMDVFLVCTEKPPKHCHRFLLMDMMNGRRING